MTNHLLSPYVEEGGNAMPEVLCKGPPTVDRIQALRDLTADPESGVEGLIVDLRGDDFDKGLLQALAELRRPLVDWLAHTANARPPVLPLVLLCDDSPAVRRLHDFAEQAYDCPSFWFSTGCELLASQRFDGNEVGNADIFRDGRLALKRLGTHPFIALGERADELRKDPIDGFGPGLDAFERPWHTDEAMHHLQIIVPSTYQLEGGASVLLSTPLVHEVLRHVVRELTAKTRGVPSYDAGCTLLSGVGWWFSPHARRWIDEEVRSAHIYLRIEPRQVRSLVRYLRIAWLQDTVFCTLDGRVMEAEPARAGDHDMDG